MKELRSMDRKLLWELIKDCRRSDRTLAKILKSSQPTITRRRAKLEKEVIDGYTAIPKWGIIGFELVAFTFIKTTKGHAKPEEQKAAVRKGKEWMNKQPSVVFSAAGQGMGWDGITISFHRSYSDFADFKRRHDLENSEIISESQTFIVDLHPGLIGKPLHFKYLAKSK
jgi:DNA-binding Lrp family transcriptional regulator